MSRYLLDTHILIWLLDGDDSLDRNIREDIDYFQHSYHVSVETLHEIVILQSLKKIKFAHNVDQIIVLLQERQIAVVPIETNHIKALEKMPTGKGAHGDPFDRMLIAQAIADKFTLISSDHKFPFYKNHGLQLLVNEF